MKIAVETIIRHPVEEVYRAYRDELPKLARYIPDVENIEVASREVVEGGVDLHNVWISSREIPTFARAILKPDMLRWDDYAKWRDEAHRVDWRIATRVFTDSVRCTGHNTFREVAGGTELRMDGDFDVSLKDIPGVPRLLAGSLKPKVEKFIVSLITPNLERVNSSLQRYLDEQAR